MEKSTGVAGLLCGLALSLPLAAQPPAAPSDGSDTAPAPQAGQGGGAAVTAFGGSADPFADDAEDSHAKAMRLSVNHEGSYRTSGSRGLVNHRSSFRVEYSKFFLDSFFVQFDSKLNAFWGGDHRARAEGKRVAYETNTPEAFLQYSRPGTGTSVKLGIQKLIWGESEGGAITDEVSPRNLSELFFIPLDESRIGQFMLNVDHFSTRGDWSFLFVPNPKFNKYPRPGSAYFFDPFAGQAEIAAAPEKRNEHEYGMRWRKSYGNRDVSFMAASLIDNDYALRVDGMTPAGRPLVARVPQRFGMTGTTFNYTKGDFLFKGEVGYKVGKPFNDAALQILEKDVVESSLGLTYALGRSNTLGVELVNSRILQWTPQVSTARRDTTSLVVNNNFFFLNDNLSINWLTIYSRPHTSYQSSLRASYKLDDNTSFGLDAHFIDAPDRNSPLRRFQDQDQVVFRIQYQF